MISYLITNVSRRADGGGRLWGIMELYDIEAGMGGRSRGEWESRGAGVDVARGCCCHSRRRVVDFIDVPSSHTISTLPRVR